MTISFIADPGKTVKADDAFAMLATLPGLGDTDLLGVKWGDATKPDRFKTDFAALGIAWLDKDGAQLATVVERLVALGLLISDDYDVRRIVIGGRAVSVINLVFEGGDWVATPRPKDYLKDVFQGVDTAALFVKNNIAWRGAAPLTRTSLPLQLPGGYALVWPAGWNLSLYYNSSASGQRLFKWAYGNDVGGQDIARDFNRHPMAAYCLHMTQILTESWDSKAGIAQDSIGGLGDPTIVRVQHTSSFWLPAPNRPAGLLHVSVDTIASGHAMYIFRGPDFEAATRSSTAADSLILLPGLVQQPTVDTPVYTHEIV